MAGKDSTAAKKLAPKSAPAKAAPRTRAAAPAPASPPKGRARSSRANLPETPPPAALRAGPTTASKPRKKRPASLPRVKKGPWMAPSEEQKMRWGFGLLAALLLVVALVSGEITWTGDGVKIGLRKPKVAAPSSVHPKVESLKPTPF